MASVYKRKSDKARGKAGKYTMSWLGADGKKHTRVGTTDRTKSLEIANRLEAEALLVKEGLVDPNAAKHREAAGTPLGEHIADYRLELLAKGGSAKHANHVKGVLTRLLKDATVANVNDLAYDRISAALGRLYAARSARTANHAMGAIKAFSTWLEHAGRIKEAPKGFGLLKPYNEDANRKRVRRALTFLELAKLLAAAELGPSTYIYGPTKSKHHKIEISGLMRAALYRLAMGTGFRANELRSLTPESFRLDGNEPAVVLSAAVAKNGKEAVQPITRELAEGLKAFVSRAAPGKPVLVVPDRTAQMLATDLAVAGIPYEDSAGRVVDFHALRHSYITHLIASGVNPKIVQTLARHSTITLTLDRYTHLEDGDTRAAIEKASDSVQR